MAFTEKINFLFHSVFFLFLCVTYLFLTKLQFRKITWLSPCCTKVIFLNFCELFYSQRWYHADIQEKGQTKTKLQILLVCAKFASSIIYSKSLSLFPFLIKLEIKWKSFLPLALLQMLCQLCFPLSIIQYQTILSNNSYYIMNFQQQYKNIFRLSISRICWWGFLAHKFRRSA